MEILRLRLHKFKPLLHKPITTLEIDYTEPTQIIIGDNGSGKSSILREITPLPAVSSRFVEKEGCKELVVSHNNSAYTLISDFSNARHTHSFLKDDTELNVSGTSTVQKELCETELGYTTTMQKLLEPGMSFTAMRKAERKTFMFELYPTDLLFLLEKHKLICSSMRACRNQLKMLYEMRAELTAQIMSKDAIKDLEATKQDLVDKINVLEKVIFLIQNEIDKVQNLDEYDAYAEDINLDKVKARVDSVIRKGLKFRKLHPELFQQDSFELMGKLTDNRMDAITASLKQQRLTAENVRETLKEYEAFKDTSVEEETKRLTDLIATLKGQLHDCVPNAAVPVVPEESLDNLKNQTLPKIRTCLDQLDDLGTKYWSATAVRKAESKVEEWKSILTDMKYEHNTWTGIYSRSESDYNRRSTMTPPAKCNFDCNLKKNFEKIIQKSHNEMQNAKKNIAEIERQQTVLERRLERLENAMSNSTSAMPIIEQLEMLITWNSWDKYVLNSGSLLNVLNGDKRLIINKLLQIIRNSERAHSHAKLSGELKAAEEHLKAIKNSNLPAKELIQRTLTNKTAELNTAVHEIRKLESTLTELASLKGVIKEAEESVAQLETFENAFNKRSRQIILKKFVEFDTGVRDEMLAAKNRLSEKLRELETVLNKQITLKSRLDETISPQVTKVEKELHDLKIVEPVLRKLPNKYMVEFTNAILKSMNDLIEHVWGYGLSMEYVNPERQFDYTFPVIIREGNSVDDCSECSKGEREILDLAWLFATCKVLKIGSQYPIRLDEPDSGLSDGNRTRFLELVSTLARDGHLRQLFFINHHYSLFSAFSSCEILCLNSENIVLPPVYNEHAKLT